MLKARVSVREYHPGLADAFRRFASVAWSRQHADRGRSSATREAPEPARDAVGGPIFVFLRGDDVVGHIGTLPMRVSCGGKESGAHWVVGLMVLSQHRKGPVGPLLVRKATQVLDLSMSLHVEEAALRIFKGCGWRCLGVVPQYVHILRGRRFLSQAYARRMDFLRRLGLAGWLGGAASWALARIVLAGLAAGVTRTLRAGAWLWHHGGGRVRAEAEPDFGPDYDSLWRRVGHKFHALVVRDREYLHRRYRGGGRSGRYHILARREKGELTGFCIVKVMQFRDDPRMGNLRVGTLVDCLFDPERPSTLWALLRDAVRFCRHEGTDVIFCTASHAGLRRELLLSGFLRSPGSLNFAYHDHRSTIDATLPLRAWHLMRGDSDADSNL